MSFSSTLFLFAFLPIVLAVYWLLPGIRARNAFLLASSLAFYTWGEAGYVLVLLASIALNYGFGLWVEHARGKARAGGVLSLAVAANLALLGFFKYANFFADALTTVARSLGLPGLELAPVHLPIGISFFTFQALTYVVDIYRGDAAAQKNPLRVGLYISLFPQLIAGPIVRYQQVAAQLTERSARIYDISAGLRRFIVGLAKKVLLANTLAVPADAIFAAPASSLDIEVAWFGLLCYALQIFFDFSGYSDMAIGLGRTLGFSFPENFNHPYSAKSIREFWRRWHMSLSSWFRDYLYIPLGGNRRGQVRTQVHLVVVFFLCGLWHGASWNFVLWGLLHGLFLSIERTSLGKLIHKGPAVIAHGYVIIVVLLAWVFFRTSDLTHALDYLVALSGGGLDPAGQFPFALYYDAKVGSALWLGVALCLPATTRLWARGTAIFAVGPWQSMRLFASASLLLLCAMALAAGTHNPFIYFRF